MAAVCQATKSEVSRTRTPWCVASLRSPRESLPEPNASGQASSGPLRFRHVRTDQAKIGGLPLFEEIICFEGRRNLTLRSWSPRAGSMLRRAGPREGFSKGIPNICSQAWQVRGIWTEEKRLEDLDTHPAPVPPAWENYLPGPLFMRFCGWFEGLPPFLGFMRVQVCFLM